MQDGQNNQHTRFSVRVVFPAFVLLSGIAATVLATWLVAVNLRVRNRERLREGIHQIELAIESRMEAYVSLLRGGAGLFAAKPQVTKAEFQKFYDRLEITRRYPGLQGYGYTVRITRDQLPEVLQAARQQGRTNFRVWPEEPVRDEYHAIIFLEPEDERNRKAIGFDMSTEGARREAMAAARDSGNPVFSAKVKLVQELDDKAPQPGFLLYVPIYYGGDVPPNVEQRRHKLQGFVYSPFRAGNLFSETLGKNVIAGLEFAIWDGPDTTPDHLLYKSHPEFDPGTAAETRRVNIAGRQWSVAFATSPRVGRSPGGGMLAVLTLLGVLASVWLAALARKEANARWHSERAAQQLSEQREWLDVTLASIADAVITTDVVGRVEFMNAAAEQITGQNAKETLGRPIADFFSIREEKSGQPLPNPAERVLSTGEVVRFPHDVLLRTRSGSETHIDASGAPLRDRQHELLGAVLVFRQTAERRRYEQAIAETEELYRAIAETAADGVIVIDQDGRIMMVNSAVERIFGYSAGELTGRSVAVLMPERLREEYFRNLAHFLVTGEKRTSWSGVEIPGLRRDGKEVPLEVSCGAAKRGGRYIFTGFLRDITERKRAEAAIRDLNQELETRVQRRTAALLESKEHMESFTYTVAHDLRAPLRAMQGFAHALIEDYSRNLDPAGQDYLRRVMASAERMDVLIQDLLAYSQLSRSDLRLGSVNIQEAINAAIEEHEAEIQAKQAEIHVQGQGGWVKAHAATLEHALSNLISNALKFVAPGQIPCIEIIVERKNASTRVFVRDNGIGVAPEHQERIFRVFERLHGPEEYPGTGIGLAIVKKGIERMGGQVGMSSEVGKSTEFWIDLQNSA